MPDIWAFSTVGTFSSSSMMRMYPLEFSTSKSSENYT
jgi:hypothetical protein